MMMKTAPERKAQLWPRNTQRAGLTVLQFVGCVISVMGGAWLGAIYLGVDIRHLAHTALAQAELLDKVPPEWQPLGPEDNMTREQLVATLREELGVLRHEIAALRAGDDKPASTELPAAQASETNVATTSRPSSKDLTRAYWLRINDIALGEAALQQDAESAYNESNAAKVFAIKGQISRFAAKAVDTVPRKGVDGSVVQFGRQLGAWYEHAGELYEQAVQVWESPTTKEGRAELNHDWRRAELQHRNEARLLNDKAAAVRDAISRQFDEEFPEFAKPGGTVTSSSDAKAG